MKRYVVFCCLVALALTACAGKQKTLDADNPAVVHLAMEEGLELAHTTENAVLVDVRHKSEYDGGHIHGARLLTLEKINKKTARETLPDRTQPIFVYCRSGHRSRLASNALAKLGYTAIYEIGGILDYTGQTE